MMKAIVQDEYGCAEELKIREIPLPTIEDDEVLVRVEAASIGMETWHLTTGRPYVLRLVTGINKPTNPVPGLDFAGVVEAVGNSVTKFKIGDEVFGTGNGSLAAYTAAKENRVAHKPSNLSYPEAAAIPVSATAAWHALHTGNVRAGQNVLIIGASGGMGSYAVQIAKGLGANVTGVCSTSKVAFVQAIGADQVVDYKSQDFIPTKKTWKQSIFMGKSDSLNKSKKLNFFPKYDVVIDIAGNRKVSDLRRVLTARGTLVIAGGENASLRWFGGVSRQLGACMLSPFIKQRLTTFVSEETEDYLAAVLAMIQEGTVRPQLDEQFELQDAAKAIDRVEKGLAKGKVTIKVVP